MNEPSASPPAPVLANWVLSVIGVLGIIVVFIGVLALANNMSLPATAPTADVTAERKANLADVQGKENSLYNEYSWVDQDKKIVRIPVPEAMRLMVAKLSAATQGLPAAPGRYSLGWSPVAATPPPSATALAAVQAMQAAATPGAPGAPAAPASPPPTAPAATAPAAPVGAAPAPAPVAPVTPAPAAPQPAAQPAVVAPAPPAVPTQDELTTVNDGLKKLLSFDPDAKAIFDKYPNLNLLARGFGGGFGARGAAPAAPPPAAPAPPPPAAQPPPTPAPAAR